MAFAAKKWRRLHEVARRQKCLDRFEADLSEEIRSLGVARTYGRGISFNQIFEHFVEDGREILHSWSPASGGGRSGVRLVESGINTAMFANITGQIVYQMMIETFESPAYIGPLLCPTKPTAFSGERIPGMGRIGDAAESVGENEAYPMVGVSEEWIDTPETVKRGLVVPVTKEALFFDRTGLVLQRAAEVGEWLAVNKEKRILDAVLGITSLYRRNGSSAIATYGDNSGSHDWDNLAASNALQDYTDVENVLNLFDDITDPNTGEPVIINSTTIVVPTALLFTAARMINATEVREVTNTNTTTISGNPLRGTRTNAANTQVNLVSSQYVKARTSSATTWFVGDFAGAFAYMENFPLKVDQAPASSELEFSHDIVARWKGSERGAPAALNPRKVAKATA